MSLFWTIWHRGPYSLDRVDLVVHDVVHEVDRHVRLQVCLGHLLQHQELALELLRLDERLLDRRLRYLLPDERHLLGVEDVQRDLQHDLGVLDHPLLQVQVLREFTVDEDERSRLYGSCGSDEPDVDVLVEHLHDVVLPLLELLSRFYAVALQQQLLYGVSNGLSGFVDVLEEWVVDGEVVPEEGDDDELVVVACVGAEEEVPLLLEIVFLGSWGDGCLLAGE